MRELLAELTTALEQRRPLVYCALVETRGSTPQKAGAAMLVFADGSQRGTLGGGCVEAEVKQRALRTLNNGGRTEVLTFNLDSNYGWDDGLICGGRMSVLADPLATGSDRDIPSASYYHRLRELLDAGTGCTEAVMLGGDRELLPGSRFLFDAEARLVSQLAGGPVPDVVRQNLPSLSTRPGPSVRQGVAYLPVLPRVTLVGDIGATLKQVVQRDLNPSIYALIVTRGHNHDEEALYHLARSPAGYVGMIGSRRKIRLIYEDLIARGIPEEALARVHAPLGFDIGSQTVAEIAVSIVAELIACRNLGTTVPQPRVAVRPGTTRP